MAIAPTPEEILDRSVEEGKRRLDQSLLELTATSFIAGFTIVFGMIALGIVEAVVKPEFGRLAHLGGALAFGLGMVFLVVGRAELFNENFLDPVAAVVDDGSDRTTRQLLRLWAVTFFVNLAGGGVMVLILSVEGVLPTGTPAALSETAREIVSRRPTAEFAAAVAGGILITLLSFLLVAVNQVGSRIWLAYVVGVLLALGPFDHVIVTMLHVWFGVVYEGGIGLLVLAETTAIVTAGNLVGGLGIGVGTHLAQTHGARESRGD